MKNKITSLRSETRKKIAEGLFLIDLCRSIESSRFMVGNGSQLKNPGISGALYILRIQYSYTQTQCEDGARDVRIL